MDGDRFDNLTRTFASPASRRRLLRGGVAGAAAVLLGRGGVAAKAYCGGSPCGHTCCKSHCCAAVDDVCTDAGQCCPATRTCGIHCCPKGNVGCTEIRLPDGSIEIGCLCPHGTYPFHNACIPCHGNGKTCTSDLQCCSSSCCNGHCCPSGQFCTGGQCVCESGQVTCGDRCCPQDHVCLDGTCACGPDHLDCHGVCVPKKDENGSPGCCSDADCGKNGGFCCLAGPDEPSPCDPHFKGCGPDLHRCVACL